MSDRFLASLAESNVNLRSKRFSGEIAYSVENSKRYALTDIRRNKIDIGASEKREYETIIDVTDKGIRYHLMIALKHMAGIKGRTAVLNPGSYLSPGGNYLSGSNGFEEIVCANSTLYEVLSKNNDYYEWNNAHVNKGLYTNVCLYTPDIVICDNSQKSIGQVDFITCSPPEYGKVQPSKVNKAVRDRAELIFNVAVRNNIKHLVLCGFGCLNPQSDVEYIANAFHDITTIYSARFDSITYVMEFGRGADVFRRVFNTLV